MDGCFGLFDRINLTVHRSEPWASCLHVNCSNFSSRLRRLTLLLLVWSTKMLLWRVRGAAQVELRVHFFAREATRGADRMLVAAKSQVGTTAGLWTLKKTLKTSYNVKYNLNTRPHMTVVHRPSPLGTQPIPSIIYPVNAATRKSYVTSITTHKRAPSY